MTTLLSLLSGFRRGNARRSANRSLHSLSAAQLADLGIPADRIDDVVDEMLMLNVHSPVPTRAVASTAVAGKPAGARPALRRVGELRA